MFDWLKSKFQKQTAEDKNKKAKDFVLSDIMFSHHTLQGEGPKKNENQDSILVADQQKEIFFAFGVFDGHGNSGKEASNAAVDNFQKHLDKNASKILKLTTNAQIEKFVYKMFETCESKMKNSGIDYSNSGTCSVFIILKDNMITVANLGDSRAVLCRVGTEKMAIELSWDQKPTRKDEKQRIIASGGKIEKLIHNGDPVGPFRVWVDEEGPGIAMTRTLGDLHAKKIGLISKPEIDHLALKKRDKFIVCASDGIWDVMTSAEVVGFILKREDQWFKDPSNPHKIADELCTEARNRWEDSNGKQGFANEIGDFPTARHGIDDVTCVIAFFNFEDGEGKEQIDTIIQSGKDSMLN